MVCKTKLDSSFPRSELKIPGYRFKKQIDWKNRLKKKKKDRNQDGRGLIFYVNQDIPCKTINTFNFPNSLGEAWLLEINLRNIKILVTGCYKPQSLHDEYFLDRLHDALSFSSTTYDNFLLPGVLRSLVMKNVRKNSATLFL